MSFESFWHVIKGDICSATYLQICLLPCPEKMKKGEEKKNKQSYTYTKCRKGDLHKRNLEVKGITDNGESYNVFQGKVCNLSRPLRYLS